MDPPPDARGLLVVNADDLGLDATTTDAILAAHRDGLVSSATLMVHMEDSARAAGLAARAGLPLGLHLNLSEGYTATAVPADVAARQARWLGLFGERARRLLRWLPAPWAARSLDAVVRDQLASFRDVVGSEPTHVDGHKHVHVSPTVGRLPALRDRRLRRAFDDRPGTPAPFAVARRVRHDVALGHRAVSDHLLALVDLEEPLRAGRLPAAIAQARHTVVEVMAHPGLAGEDALLRLPAWRAALDELPLGSFATP